MVSLAPESTKVGISPPLKFWKLLLTSAIAAVLSTLSLPKITPEFPGASGTLADRMKCSVVPWLEEAAFAHALCPKFSGNWPSFPPPGQ